MSRKFTRGLFCPSRTARRPALRDEGGPAVLFALLRRLLRRVLRQLRRTDRRRPGPNVARGSALARDRGLLLLRDLPHVPPGSAVPAATWCHLLQHRVQQGRTADDAERLLRRAATASAVVSQVTTVLFCLSRVPSPQRVEVSREVAFIVLPPPRIRARKLQPPPPRFNEFERIVIRQR